MKKTNFLLIIALGLVSCSGLKDVGKVFRNEKTTTTDEFLVKKRQPLSLPPDYENIPEPRTDGSIKNENKEEINKILKIPKNNTISKGSTNVEQSIINQIRK